MKILSIYQGHCATVAYFKDGEIIDCISEEKFNNIKNYLGFPIESIKWILDKNELDIDDFDKIGIVGQTTACDGVVLNKSKSKSDEYSLVKRVYRWIDYHFNFRLKDEIIKKIQLYRFL